MSQRPYRARRKDDNEWVKGSLIQNFDRCYIVISKISIDYRKCDYLNQELYWHFDEEDIVEVQPSTVSRSTGKHDKNGDEIFEGMTVHYEWHDPEYQEGEEYTGAVYFENGAFWLQMTLNSYGSKNLVIIPEVKP